MTLSWMTSEQLPQITLRSLSSSFIRSLRAALLDAF